MATLRDLTDNPGRSTSNDAEAGDDHVRGHDSAVEDSGVVLDDGHLSDDNSLPDMHMAPDACGLNNSVLPNEDMVADPQWQVGKGAMGWSVCRRNLEQLMTSIDGCMRL